MALPKKGTRRIHVDGHDYRWIVSPNDGWMDLVVERYRNPAQRLVVQISYGYRRDEDSNCCEFVDRTGKKVEITPALVERAIRSGLAEGWVPSGRGKEIRVRQG
jgi:hypothetical protein